MPLCAKLTPPVSLALLAACTSVAETDALTERLSQVAIYQPALADGDETLLSALSRPPTSERLPTGFMGFPDGTVKPVQLSTNADQTVVFISIDGEPPIILDRIEATPTVDGFTGGFTGGPDPLSIAVVEFREFPANAVAVFSEAIDGRGYYGLETVPANLPATEVFHGTFETAGVGVALEGSFTLHANFDNGTVTGPLTAVYIEPTLSSYEPVTGEIAGVLVESRMAAGVTISGDGIDGALAMVGGVFGETAISLSGGIAGTVNGNPLGGPFLSVIAD